jgi:hypothetical protein
MIEGWVPLFHGYGHSARVDQLSVSPPVFEYDTPWVAGASGGAEIYWQKQPGTLDDRVDVIWNDGSGHTYTAGGNLGHDRVLILSPKGVTIAPGQPAKAQLPSLGLG